MSIMCIAMVYVMETLNSIQGVTFLAFGNGAPDLFSAIAALSASSDNPELGIAGLFGESNTYFRTVCVYFTVCKV